MVSKVGKSPVVIPSRVTVNVKEGKVAVVGPKGSISLEVPRDLKVLQGESVVKVEIDGGQRPRGRVSKLSQLAASHGLFRSLLANAVSGVINGWSRSLELVGTGYRAALVGQNLSLSVGFSHQVVVEPPEGIVFSVDGNKVTVFGVDKQKVGKAAAEIRAIRPPEPYKGKGIKYVEEKVRRKAGKAAKAAAGATGAK